MPRKAAEALRRGGRLIAYVTPGRMADEISRAVEPLGLERVDDARPIHAELAELYQNSARTGDAIKKYELLLAANPGDAVAANNLAMLLVAGHPDAAKLRRAADLARPFAASANPQFLDTFGWVTLKQGDAQSALAALEKASAAATRVE